MSRMLMYPDLETLFLIAKILSLNFPKMTSVGVLIKYVNKYIGLIEDYMARVRLEIGIIRINQNK